MPYVEWQEQKVYYRSREPKGHWEHTLLLVHGAGGNLGHWQYQLSQAEKWGCRVMAVDLPGHGRSEGKPCPSIEKYSNFLKDFLNILEISDFSLGGHSMGGGIILDFATKRMLPCSSLILISTGAQFRVLDSLFSAFKKGLVPRELIRSAYSSVRSKFFLQLAYEEAKKVSPQVFLNDFLACQNFNVSADLFRINCPCLVLCGQDDLLTPVTSSLFLKEKLNTCFLHILARGGHMLMIEEHEIVNNLIGEFLQKESKKA
ncbi:MAG: alpha/beta hydrolase [Clostridia bacterium]|jgi:pimeloyl-ACP methyl ester carboxylesterase|nr:alpha/beta hydrolase [Clostridia bacterium]